MIRKAFSGIMLALMLIGVALGFIVHPAKASGTTYIRADGTIDPATSPMQRNGDVYTFTDNVYDCSIVVERDNIVIDGLGYTLQGTQVFQSIGIVLLERTNVTVQNTQIAYFQYGIKLYGSSHSNISRNDIAANWGIAIWLDSSSHNIISRNNIKKDNGYAVWLWNSSYNNVSENNVETYGNGIYIYSSSCNSVSGNNITRNFEGILLEDSSYNIISRNNIRNNTCGICLSGSSGSIISGNNVTASYWYGFYVVSSSYNNISENSITANREYGFNFWGSSGNVISGNDITANGYFGIGLTESSSNRFYHNNLVGNPRQVYDPSWTQPYRSPSVNVWDDGYPSGGNYWSDYAGVDLNNGIDQNVLGSDEVGDTPYIIDTNNRDHYPLMKPWAPTPPTIMASLDICPDVLNLISKGKWVTAYIQLPEDFNPEDIVASTSTLGGTIQPVLDPSNDFVTNSSEYLVDYDGDGILERMIKFDRASIASWICQNVGMQHEVSLTITGELADGTPFEGTDTISVVYTGGGGGRRK